MASLPLRGALVAAALSTLSMPADAQVVISQMYGGGGNGGSLYTHDFIELFNRGDTAQDLSGWSVQYTSASGSTWQVTPLGNITLQPGQYLLIQQAQGAGGTQPLPTPDVTGSIAMGGSSGKVALADTETALEGVACPAAALDIVSASGSNCEGTTASGMNNSTSIIRADGGCTDTDDNSADFSPISPPTPRNTATPLNVCGGGGTDLVLSIANASVAEGNAGTTTMSFTVTLSGPAPVGGVAFTASTADGTATAPADYAALAAQAFSIAEGQTSAGVDVSIVGDTLAEPDETFTVTLATAAAGVVLGQGSATGTIVNDDVDTLEIFQIQGSGLRSPYAPASGNNLGQQVGTEGNVVTAVSANGFFMQTPDARDDDDAATSNGIFVHTGGAPSVQVGDVVDVTGRVQEYFDWTQLANTTVTVTGTAALPTAIALDETTPSPDPAALSCGDTNFECLENMHVHVAAGAVVMGNQRFGSDPFGEAFVTASGERARREKGLLPTIVPPPAPGLPVWDGNPEVFELDADGAGAVPTGTAIFGGELFEATGVIAYQFGNYALRPVTLTRVPADLPRPVPDSNGDAELRVGSLNALNLCVGSCDPVKVGRIAAYVGDVLQLPDVLGLQEVGSEVAAQTLADRLNTDFGTDYAAYSETPPAGDGIRNAFLVRAGRVDVTRVRELQADVTITQCSGTPPCPLHDRPPYLLEGTFTGGDGERFAVMNNHTRSLIGIDEPAPEGPRVRYKRFEQGKAIATLVQRFQLGEELEPSAPVGDTDTADVPLVMVGDYNAFEVTDGLVDVVGLIAGTYDDAENEYQLAGPNIVDPPLHNLVLDVPLEDRYSYTFREELGNLLGEAPRHVGSIQVLDHGLLNAPALTWCGGLVYGRGNADAPAELRNNGTGAIGSSDHDGFVVRLFTDRLFGHDFEQPGRCMR